MSRVEREAEAIKPIDAGPGMPGPGPEGLVGSGEIDEPVPQGMFLELLGLMAKLKGRRQAKGLSLTDASERSGLSRQAISRLENGWNATRRWKPCALRAGARRRRDAERGGGRSRGRTGGVGAPVQGKMN